MLCPECRRGASGARVAASHHGGAERPSRGRGEGRCGQCGRPLVASDSASRLLEKLARLDAFGLAPSAGPLFAVDVPGPES